MDTIGQHCSLQLCNERDYLPITCNRCDRVYCKNHVFPDYHQCPSLSITPPIFGSAAPLQRCALVDCNKLSLESFVSDPQETANRQPAVCSGCNQSFCVTHRHSSSHACMPELPKMPAKNEAARALLSKHFASSFAPPTAAVKASKSKTTDPNKLAQIRKVELMKMRHRAVPGDPKNKQISTNFGQKIHLQVAFDGDTASAKVYWFPKALIAGKALDLLASHFQVPASGISLCREDQSSLQLNQSLSEQLEDGSSIIICRSES